MLNPVGAEVRLVIHHLAFGPIRREVAFRHHLVAAETMHLSRRLCVALCATSFLGISASSSIVDPPGTQLESSFETQSKMAGPKARFLSTGVRPP